MDLNYLDLNKTRKGCSVEHVSPRKQCIVAKAKFNENTSLWRNRLYVYVIMVSPVPGKNG